MIFLYTENGLYIETGPRGQIDVISRESREILRQFVSKELYGGTISMIYGTSLVSYRGEETILSVVDSSARTIGKMRAPTSGYQGNAAAT